MALRKKHKPISTTKRFALASRIRASYFILLIPIIILQIISIYYIRTTSRTYDGMIQSVVKASEFSLDFKNDFDYEAYLLIVGNKIPSDPTLDNMLKNATEVVEELESLTDTRDNLDRLRACKKYLNNLEEYKEHIVENLSAEEMYDENMKIWENDVQVVTSLLQESVHQYIYYEIKDLEQSQERYQNFFRTVLRVTIGALVIIIILILVVSYYISRLLDQVREEQVRLRKAELLVLQSQINPHFLYNTLDAITWLAEAGEQRQVVRMVGSLSGFFRATLGEGKDVVTLKDEIGHIRSYLEIQGIRYQDILTYKIAFPKELYAVEIPKITLQPLVENALYHGIKNKRGGGRIEIWGEETDDGVCLHVSDDGVGMSAMRLTQVRDGILHKVPEEKGIYGLYNVNERIRLHFGDAYGLHIESTEGEGTTATVILPKVDTK